ncbi:hypothetical protein [Thermophilibacter mediterraneus]|uniref:hypothetical protein n=1 Tax=Thermophilibacter mediterraneus TaxID=1871031 RepID=UPI0009320686|nr:hypothetical protein [Thermophilibacter mediterraneus]
MARRKHTDDLEDDGRVIADMSAVERPSLMGRQPVRRSPDEPAREGRGARRPKIALTTKERVWLALGAMKAGFVVSMVFVAFIGAIILVLLALWTS